VDDTSPAPSRYTVTDVLGEGGSGNVVRAWDQQLGRYVAIKRLRADRLIEAEILREAEFLAALQHPNIVTLFDVGTDAEGIFVVMELVSGRTLEEYVTGRRMTVPFFYELADQLCRGLAAAHARGLVHQDLKPGNVMLHIHEDNTFTAKILDFGLAKAGQHEVAQDEGPIVGSVYTITPEQLRRQPIDSRTDIYSLGCIFYFTLLGRYPYEAESTEEIIAMHLNRQPVPLHMLRPEVPPAISDLIKRMMAHSPDARPQTVKEVRDTIRQVSKPRSASATPSISEVSKRSAGKRWIVPVAAVASLAVAAVGWWLFSTAGPEPALKETQVAPTPAEYLKVSPTNPDGLAAAKDQKIEAEGEIVGYEKSNLLKSFNLHFSQDKENALWVALPESVFSEDDAKNYVGKRVRVRGMLKEVLRTFRVTVEDKSQLELLSQK
jgi:serine/threonine protein kinase